MTRKIDLVNSTATDGRLAMRRLETLNQELKSKEDRAALRLAITAWRHGQSTERLTSTKG